MCFMIGQGFRNKEKNTDENIHGLGSKEHVAAVPNLASAAGWLTIS